MFCPQQTFFTWLHLQDKVVRLTKDRNISWQFLSKTGPFECAPSSCVGKFLNIFQQFDHKVFQIWSVWMRAKVLSWRIFGKCSIKLIKNVIRSDPFGCAPSTWVGRFLDQNMKYVQTAAVWAEETATVVVDLPTTVFWDLQHGRLSEQPSPKQGLKFVENNCLYSAGSEETPRLPVRLFLN